MAVERITDKKLFRLAKKQKEAKLAEAAAKKEATTLSDQIIPEMKRRKLKALESQDGTIRVNKVEGDFTTYDLDSMKEVLGSALYKKCITEVANPEAINEMIAQKKITGKQLAKFAKTQAKAPYILVTLKEGK